MPRGPLPNPERRRRNAPTIPTTKLPAGGFQEPTPDVPGCIDLGEAGMAWWEWAWHTPQAAAWDDGQAMTVAHRASLEDDLRIQNQVDNLDFLELMNKSDEEAVRRVIRALAALATGRVALMKECRALDADLGLTPKGMAALRWQVVADKKQEEAAPKPGNVTAIDERRKRIAAAANA